MAETRLKEHKQFGDREMASAPNEPSRMSNSANFIQGFKTHFQPYGALKNWFNLIVTAKTALDVHPATDVISPEDVITGTGTFQHLRRLSQTARTMHSLKIISNIETASMHLRYLLEVSAMVG
jgi:hypothetical protein